MLGALIAAGIGAAGFRMGYETHKLSNEGLNDGEIAYRVCRCVADDVADGCRWCRDRLGGLFRQTRSRGPGAQTKKS